MSNKFTVESEYLEEFSVQENGDEVIFIHDKLKKQDATNDTSERVVEELNPPQVPADELINELPHSSVSDPSSLQRPAAIEEATDVGDWSREEIIFLTKKYEEYIHCVGKGKLFKHRINMWNTIAFELNNTFKGQKSPLQCKTKFSNDFEAFKNKLEEREKTNLLGNFEGKMNALEPLLDDIVKLEEHNSEEKINDLESLHDDIVNFEEENSEEEMNAFKSIETDIVDFEGDHSEEETDAIGSLYERIVESEEDNFEEDDFETFKNKQEHKKKTEAFSNFEEEMNAIQSLQDEIIELEENKSILFEVGEEETYNIFKFEIERKIDLSLTTIKAKGKERIHREKMKVVKEFDKRSVRAIRKHITKFWTKSEENSS